MWSLCTIPSSKTYAPDLGERTILIHFVKLLPSPVCNDATTFFAITQYLFDFAMQSYLFQNWVIFFYLKPFRSILPVLGSNVAGSPVHSTLLMLRAFNYNLYPVSFTFLCHFQSMLIRLDKSLILCFFKGIFQSIFINGPDSCCRDA